jgi:Lrp/AsnC family leucine-responsive transcriptional regulator
LDEKDEAIIKLLERRAGLSNRSLSKFVGLPISTVHRRIKKLEKDGIITGYKALINYEKTGRPIGAIILVNLAEHIPGVGHIPKQDVIEEFKKIDEIEEITEVQASTFDIVLKARLGSLKELSDLMEQLRSVQGIEEAVASIIIDENVVPPNNCMQNTEQ